jgi:amino acid adenylation domain-containing protein
VHGPDATLSYGEIDRLANQIARALTGFGVRKGDRVGLWIEKTARTVAAMQGVLRIGAVYVPVDPQSPETRAHGIFEDCQVRALVTTLPRADAIRTGALANVPVLLASGGPAPNALTWAEIESQSSDLVDDPTVGEHDLAYILYTSGSTGKPKGVCISHRNALAFVEWAAADLRAGPRDRFSNHAPFHFDLSVLDLYCAFLVGARVSIIPEAASYSAKRLVEFMCANEISIWYSVPSVLILMMDSGGLLDVDELPTHTIIFAGEVFPIKHCRTMRNRWPKLRLLNYYGPTETNVCTWYEVHDIPEEQVRPVPIGVASSGDRVWAARPDGSVANPGEPGELLVEGPTVMLGYWGKPPHGSGPYHTGDIVVQLPDGSYDFQGRKDHQVKVRGHRIELGEIEAALLAYPDLKDAAVVVAGDGPKARLVAFVVSSGGQKPSLLSIKRHCADRLPNYMIVDKVTSLGELPRTPNGKVDRLKLRQMAETAPAAPPYAG